MTYADTPAVRLTRLTQPPLGDYLPMLKKRLGIDFDDHNDLLEGAIAAAVGKVETFTRHLLSQCQVQVSYGPGLIDAEIPFGPIIAPPDDLPVGATLTDEPFATLQYANSSALTVLTYKAGYSGPALVPAQFKTAVVILAAELSGFGEPGNWKALVVEFRRATWAD
ncbi:head-tail connector protein [Fibrella forsythiae]|uniref:Phage head-tail connector protein n=1 Tax=Fibrella forsythiae TaxID=2817061 RepID=A0ABS3JC13_9BACT|nr:head-tail connector protein [Fibrella forsythiae]MBO0947526.1 phage head-tail connector protein [Fibrella forsythiae]